MKRINWKGKISPGQSLTYKDLQFTFLTDLENGDALWNTNTMGNIKLGYFFHDGWTISKKDQFTTLYNKLL